MNEENISLQEGEEIKSIYGFEGLYSITSHGRIWSHEKIRRFGNTYRVFKAKFLKTQINKYGYKIVSLRKDRKRKTLSVHSLVAKTFIQKSNNLLQVNHRDCNKRNNHIDNLEWITSQDNQNHALINGLKKYKKSSNFYGIHFHKGLKNKNKPWTSETTINKKRIYIGCYKTEIEAAKAFNDFVIKHNLNRPLNELNL